MIILRSNNLLEFTLKTVNQSKRKVEWTDGIWICRQLSFVPRNVEKQLTSAHIGTTQHLLQRSWRWGRWRTPQEVKLHFTQWIQLESWWKLICRRRIRLGRCSDVSFFETRLFQWKVLFAWPTLLTELTKNTFRSTPQFASGFHYFCFWTFNSCHREFGCIGMLSLPFQVDAISASNQLPWAYQICRSDTSHSIDRLSSGIMYAGLMEMWPHVVADWDAAPSRRYSLRAENKWIPLPSDSRTERLTIGF